MILKLLYIGLAAIMTLILLMLGIKAIKNSVNEPSKQKKYIFILITGLAIWHVYTYLLASNKVLYDLGFPPRFALFLIIPLFLFTGIFLFKSRKKSWIHSISLSTLSFYQSFRIAIETIFVMSVTAGVLHAEVTLEGYNYDFFYGVSAVIVGLLLVKNKLGERAVKIWNYLGLAVITFIIFLFISTIYLPEIYGYTRTPAPLEFTLYPYVLIAGYLMPSAVFIHIWSIIQINNKP